MLAQRFLEQLLDIDLERIGNPIRMPVNAVAHYLAWIIHIRPSRDLAWPYVTVTRQRPS